ncbi:Gfo/Idh/MocA family protein [Paenibacillus koleovorans]|uniref:Gfo/Idh/MocA family protein n=1 Tax=Paenibacillus koleovorans TaxID=121608 RepID=UPI000FDB7D7E|nr:Gfo/Idh/MocA family oxidoreductase [Paenibacillus koleovorans]
MNAIEKRDPIRIGLVGLGRAGWGMHCNELKGRETEFRIVAVCDPIQTRRQEAVERYGCSAYESIEALIRDEHVELVDIASRSNDHYAHAIMAIEAGKDVLLEKPIAMRYEEGQHIAELAARRNVQVYARHNRRFDRNFLHAREVMTSGVLGDVFRIKLCVHAFSRRDDWQTIKDFGGGQLLNWGPHVIDQALQLLESPVSRIWSHLGQVAAAGDAEDDVKILLQGENKRVADIEISGGVCLPSPYLTLYGTRGSLTASGDTITMKHIDPQVILEPISANSGTPGQIFSQTKPIVWEQHTIHVNPATTYDFWDELYRSMRGGAPFPIKLEEALEVLRITDEVRKENGYELK